MLHHFSHLSPPWQHLPQLDFHRLLQRLYRDHHGVACSFKIERLLLKKTLKHFTLQEVNGVTQVPIDLIMQGCNEWSDYVVGFFIEQRLSFPYVKNIFQQRWKDKGSFEIIVDKDLFYFKFSSNEARQAVLEEGPIFIGGRCFIISPWTRSVEKQRAMDEATKQKKRIDYARLCIEVNVSAKLPNSFTVELALGDERIISFEYPWISKRCEKCQKFGHETEKCLGDANSKRLNTTNRSGKMSRLNTIHSTGLDANNVTNSQEGRQNERMTPNANVSYENAMRNIVSYAGNGNGEDVNRRIWRVRSRPSALSDGAGKGCIRNDRSKEIREQPTGTIVQYEPNSQSNGAQGNGIEIEELNTGVHETGTDPSIGLQLVLYVPAEITTPINQEVENYKHTNP
ncbi:hypothetical protein IFM89_035278 [Coptis chinensis]|uniref:DUF4283 domain-containing protein n=1 Tax=Coptis chinensis TaxID=261450 RepID=A0A835H4C7_9MAGN|nr:hypothetical protein IFM89_035278 [Coptis chinensis]